jgi:hypothetical protein
MVTVAQDSRLSLLAAGFRGDSEAQDGVHLRWSFDPDLGFPAEGFRLFHRRPEAAPAVQVSLLGLASQLQQQPAPAAVVQGVTLHRTDGDLLPIAFRCDRVAFDLGPVPLVVRFRPTFATPPAVVREVTLTVVADKGGAVARARHGGRVAGCGAQGLKPCLTDPADPVDVARLAPGGSAVQDCAPFQITVRADAIDTVEVTGCNALLLAVSWRPVRDDECDVGWKPLAGPICLPVEDVPEYPCQVGSGRARDVALARLPEAGALPPDAPTREALEKRLLGPEFDDLRKALGQALTGGGQFVEQVPSDDAEDATSWRHDVVRDALTAAADPYFARILGLYWVDVPDDPDATFDYKVEADWPIGGVKIRFCWMAFGRGMRPQPALPEPTDVTATAQPGGAHVTTAGVLNPYEMDVAVGWRRPTDCELNDPVRSPVAYLLERTDVDGPATGPYRLLSSRAFDEGGEPEVVPAIIVDTVVGARSAAGYYLDRGPGYGTFHYRVRGVDLFARTSGPSGPATVEVRDEVPPGPPLNLAAAYADPADPERAGSTLLAWANRDVPQGMPPRAGVALGWVWPASRQQQSPDLDEFLLYYRHGAPNQVLGRITGVAPATAGRYDVTTDLAPAGPDFPAPQDAVDLGALRSAGEECPIVTLRTVGGRLAFRVRASAAAPPLVGPCTFRLGSGTSPSATQPARAPYPGFRSYELPADWGGLVLDATAPGPPRPLRIGADATVRTPLPAGLAAEDVDVVRVVEPDAGAEHWHYGVRLRGVVLVPTPERPRAVGTFGISACDTAGNEGRVAAPAGIFAVHRVPPVTPPVVYPPLNLATPADYHGYSWFTLTWTGAASTGYLVYRALDLDLLAAAGVDLAAHRARTPDEQRLELQQLGRQTTHVAAFRLVTPAPLVATGGPMSHRDALPGSVLNRFVYRVRGVDGAGNLSPWPPAAQATCVVVELPGVPPAPPAWAGTGRSEQGVAVRWAPNPGPATTGYRLYRAHDATAAEDVRSMAPLFTAAQPEGGAAVTAVTVERDSTGAEVGVTDLPSGDRPPGRVLQYLDGMVEDGRAVYYRLVAEDDQGRRSPPSDLLTVQLAKRSRPAPPGWGSPAVSTGSVALTWTAENGDVEALLLRRTGGALWRPLRPWAPAGDGAFTDAGVEAGVRYEYRVRLRDRVGHVVDGPVLTVEAL